MMMHTVSPGCTIFPSGRESMGFASARRTNLSAGSCGKSTRLASSSAAICSGARCTAKFLCAVFHIFRHMAASFPVLKSHNYSLISMSVIGFAAFVERKTAKGRRGNGCKSLNDGLK
jgi:hypothetical protein